MCMRGIDRLTMLPDEGDCSTLFRAMRLIRHRTRCLSSSSTLLLRISAALLLPLCLAFRPSFNSLASLRRQHGNNHERATPHQGNRAAGAAATATASAQKLAMGRGDVMEKIGPLIDELTVAKEMVPSDLTQDYGSVVFPDPLTAGEVRLP